MSFGGHSLGRSFLGKYNTEFQSNAQFIARSVVPFVKVYNRSSNLHKLKVALRTIAIQVQTVHHTRLPHEGRDQQATAYEWSWKQVQYLIHFEIF